MTVRVRNRNFTVIAIIAVMVASCVPPRCDDVYNVSFVEKPNHKAMAKGKYKCFYAWGAATADGAKQHAMRNCNALSGGPCKIVAVDGEYDPEYIEPRLQDQVGTEYEPKPTSTEDFLGSSMEEICDAKTRAGNLSPADRAACELNNPQ